MLERSSNRPDKGKTPPQALAQTFAPGELSVTLQSQADARCELIGAAPTDNETNRKVLSKYLDAWGCEVDETESGAAAILDRRDVIPAAVVIIGKMRGEFSAASSTAL